MAGNIFYKRETIWSANSTRFDNLSEKLLSIACKKAIDHHSDLIQFIKKLEYHTGGVINIDLNSKEEIEQFAELLELAIQEWIQEGFYDYYNYDENGKVKNQALSEYNHFAQRLREIAIYEWKNENLFIGRAYKLQPIADTLLHFAQAKHLGANSHLMRFLQKLPNREVEDIDIRSKVELEQFIELMELSVQALIDQDYFKQYDITENGKTFNYVLHNYLTYIERLKEVADDWNNAVSDEWKQGKIRIEEKPVIHRCEYLQVEHSSAPRSTIKDVIRLIVYVFLLFVAMIGILGMLVFATNAIKFLANNPSI